MRMASALTTLLAVLCGAVAGAGDLMANVSRVLRSPQPHHPHRVLAYPHSRTEEELDATAAWKRAHWREMQAILKQETAKRDTVECCPSVLEMVVKKGGRTPSGLYVELYENGDNKQQFYELSCAPGVVDKPCRFVDPRLYNQSRCVQKYSYSYALVRCSESTRMHHDLQRADGNFPVPGSGGCSMDYVMVRAGCECQITPHDKHKHKNPHRRHKKKRNRRIEVDEGGET